MQHRGITIQLNIGRGTDSEALGALQWTAPSWALVNQADKLQSGGAEPPIGGVSRRSLSQGQEGGLLLASTLDLLIFSRHTVTRSAPDHQVGFPGQRES